MRERKPIEHGTYRGYQQHRRAGEDACLACKAGNTAYHREWRTGLSDADKRHAGARRSARLRALDALSRLYPDDYRDLLEKELVEIARAAG